MDFIVRISAHTNEIDQIYIFQHSQYYQMDHVG